MNAIESFGKRALAWLVLIALGLLALKIIAGIFFGLVQALFMFLLIGVVLLGLLWALRNI